MKVIIDIPDEMYEWVNDANKIFADYGVNDFIDLVKKGVPIPKGHGNLIQREEAETIFRNARMALYKQSRTERIKDLQTRESMLLNAEQFVHLIKPIIEADKAESEDNG
jgi:hypothetical protein